MQYSVLNALLHPWLSKEMNILKVELLVDRDDQRGRWHMVR